MMSGEVVAGEAAARSRQALSEELLAKGQILVEARHVGGLAFPFASVRSTRSGLSELISFLREFMSLTRAGIPLAKALEMLEKGRAGGTLSSVIGDVRDKVAQGVALDEAMRAHAHVFPPLVSASIRAGIASGKLEPALQHLIVYLQLRRDLERKVKRALAYPVFLLVLLFVVLTVILLFVLPRFSELYSDFGAELPMITKVLLAMTKAAPVGLPLLFIIIALSVYVAKLWLRNPASRRLFDRFKLGLPLFGPLIRNSQLAQVSFVFSLMLSSGMHLRETIRQVAASTTNADIVHRLGKLEAAVVAGQSLSDGLKPLDLYPELSLNLLLAGEASGDMATMFNDVATLHRDMLEDRLAGVIALIEPVMMVVVGTILGTVIIAVYLPIFGISEVIR
jgi:type IV pilus assembly protein PilC